MKPATVYEKDIQREICDYLAQRGHFFWRQNNTPIFGRSNDGVRRFRALPKYTPKGIPDIILLSQGLMYGFEVKRPGAPIKREQLEFGEKMKAAGGIYNVVTSLEQVKTILEIV